VNLSNEALQKYLSICHYRERKKQEKDLNLLKGEPLHDAMVVGGDNIPEFLS